MLIKLCSIAIATIRHPEFLIWKCREWIDRSTRDKRHERAQMFLERNNVWSLLVAGDHNEIPPSAPDLANLYSLIRQRRPRMVLEFGVGFSTLVIAAALRDNAVETKIRGHLHCVDSEKQWIENTESKILSDLQEFVSFHYSSISATMIDNALCHIYDTLPDITPNFIYVDAPAGPKGAEISGEVHGLGFSNGRPPVGADVLLYESSAPQDFFIVVDGRWETCRFLRKHLRGRYRHRRFVARKYEIFEYQSELMAS